MPSAIIPEEGGFRSFLLTERHFVTARAEVYVRRLRLFFSKSQYWRLDRENSLQRFRNEMDGLFAPEEVHLAVSAVKLYWFFRDRTELETAVGGVAGKVNAAVIGPKERSSGLQPHQCGHKGVITKSAATEKSSGRVRAVPHLWTSYVNRAHDVLRLQHKSYRTEKTYIGWVLRFARFLPNTPPEQITEVHLRHFLTYLAVEQHVAAATQLQAFNALLFAFRHLLGREVNGLKQTVRATKPKRLPVVLAQSEIRSIFRSLESPYRLMAKLIYAGGLRLAECLSLRVKDLDFDEAIIVVRAGKGDKDRTTLFPRSLHAEMRSHLRDVRILFDNDRRTNAPGVPLPDALARKTPHASTEWAWYWVFPSRRLSVEPRSGEPFRYHVYPSSLERQVTTAVRVLGIPRQATVHSFRHSFATHLIEAGYDIRTVQELLGHSHLQTTMIYTHVATKHKQGIISPIERLEL